jgi:hypothetical protein
VIIQISEAKCSPERQKNLRTQINGKFNDINSADENKKNITVEPLFKNYKKAIIYSLIEQSEVVLVFKHNNAGFKKPSSFV